MKVYKKTEYLLASAEAGDVKVTHWERDRSLATDGTCSVIDPREGFQVHHTLSVTLFSEDKKTALESRNVSWGEMIPASTLDEVAEKLEDFIRQENEKAKAAYLKDYEDRQNRALDQQAEKNIRNGIAIAPRGMTLQQLVAANKGRGRKNGHR